MRNSLKSLLEDVRACSICQQHLPFGPRPVLQLGSNASILIAGQAPGRKVHESGIPFDDASGGRLRQWMGITDEVFYDASQIAILPMGFCFPGTGKSGDLPPRPECAGEWRQALMDKAINIRMTLILGQYAKSHYFPEFKGSLTDLVKSWQDYWPAVVPLPHPSPRNNRWLKQNAWFEANLLPALRKQIGEILSDR